MLRIRIAKLQWIVYCCVVLAVNACGGSVSHAPNSSGQAVTIEWGPTPIPAGEAMGKNDLTVSNDFFALAFSVDTASPWGVASGGILDIGIKRNGLIENDFVSLVDFMPNNWSAWPTSYQRVSIETRSNDRVVVLTERDWGEVELASRFEVVKGLNRVRITTKMHNRGDHALDNLRTGYIAWPSGGNLFGMPGLPAMASVPVDDTSAIANWSASYDRLWAMGLHASDASMVGYGGRDRYWPHTLKSGETRQFVTWLQIEPNANLAAFVATELALSSSTAAVLEGALTDSNGLAIEDSVVIVQKSGVDYGWALANNGRYRIDLPAGDYQLFPTAAGFGQGQLIELSVEDGARYQHDFSDIQAPATVELQIYSKQGEETEATHAVVSVEQGPKQHVKYFGETRFFTALEAPGRLDMSLPPGDYQFKVAAGAGFISQIKSLSIPLSAGEHVSDSVVIRSLENPNASRWYSADLHHHSDVLDGFTEPEYVMRAQLSAALDVAFLSDHDSTINNSAMNALAEERGMPFIAGTELSASWAHFNAYPIDPDKSVSQSIGSMTVQEIFSEGRRLGADVIHVNHPYGNYGYFSSLALDGSNPGAEIVPGGYDPGFDMIEMTGFHDIKTRTYAWNLWNQGKPAYFVAGSDAHDVWNVPLELSTGFARTFVRVDGELTVESYVKNLKAGHSYTSQGPLIYPELLFGTEHQHDAGQEALSLKYHVQAVRGLKSVSLVQSGDRIDTRSFDDEQLEKADIEFSVRPESDTWYSLIVEDHSGRFAYSNPLWVKVEF